MKISSELLKKLGASNANANKYADSLDNLMRDYEIVTPLQAAHFLAQIFHESGSLRLVEENLRYSAKRLLVVFPKYFNGAQAEEYAGNAERIGSRVYANRLGNGNEASGDGYRYRGRGLIQLTGKSNYGAFSTFVADNVVADPSKVGTTYAPASAVYFWNKNGLNNLADRDDIVAITKKINGGLNGLEDRKTLLLRAKELLGSALEIGVQIQATHRVITTALNIRTKPQVSSATKSSVLHQGCLLEALDTQTKGWLRVRAIVDGTAIEGWVSAQPAFVEALGEVAVTTAAPAPTPETAPPADSPTTGSTAATVLIPPPVNLKEDRADIKRTRDGGHAYPLGEPNMPHRRSASPNARARELLAIANYLAPDNTNHLRYAPKTNATYCNIYAYDYAYLAGVYLPRVWWTPKALMRIQTGEQLSAAYGDTVIEMRANSLFQWFSDFGGQYGWRREQSLTALQLAANDGEVSIIVARHKQPEGSGHIAAVAPEHEANLAGRNAQGEVIHPLTSQAGRKNFTFHVETKAWWRDSSHGAFAFWRHA